MSRDMQRCSVLGEKSYESLDGLFLQGFIKNAYLEIDHPLSDTPAH